MPRGSATIAYFGEPARCDEVRQRLDNVVDPELDEPVTDMGFISRIEVDASNCVHIDFRLPTYWCAANFAFMMADDMRTEVGALPWVYGTRIVLGDHMYAGKINNGIAEGLSFEDTFGSEADGNIDAVRRTFLVKAFQRRQEALINHLIDRGVSAGDICRMTIGDLADVRTDLPGRNLIKRYLERRGVTGPFVNQSQAFVASNGQCLEPSRLNTYLADLRRVRANAEFNGALCRGLLAVRFDMETPLPPRKASACRTGTTTSTQ